MYVPTLILFAIVHVVPFFITMTSSPAVTTNNNNSTSNRRSNDIKAILPVQSGGCPVHVPFVVQCLVVRPDVLKPSQHA